MDANLDEIKTFYDPHPGFGGAIISMPAAVKKVADELNGKKISLREAIAKIQATTDGTIAIHNGFISLKIYESNGTTHAWRVIRFK